MREGHDFIRLEGRDLARFAAPGRGGANDAPTVSSKVRSLIVLTESGVNLVCMKTDKPLGKALRRWRRLPT